MTPRSDASRQWLLDGLPRRNRLLLSHRRDHPLWWWLMKYIAKATTPPDTEAISYATWSNDDHPLRMLTPRLQMEAVKRALARPRSNPWVSWALGILTANGARSISPRKFMARRPPKQGTGRHLYV